MRRFVTLVVLLLFTIPFGVSISGCAKKSPVVFCSGSDAGIPVGQVTTITLAPQIFGVSLNQGQMGTTPTPTATDCKGTKETVSKYTYATFLADGTPSITIADVNPTTGQLCGGTWNRNSGGGIADFTTCNVTGNSGTAYVVASGSGASSNPLPIFVHPVVTSVQLGPLSTDCINDPATNCSPAAFVATQTSCTINAATGCCTVPVNTEAAASASSNGCISQGVTGQLAARVFAGSGANISCEVGHLTYAAQTASILTIDQNGVATAQQPGSTVITATVANAGSSAGFFSTCPPTNISLSIPSGSGTSPTSVVVNPNNAQPITVLATDKNNTILTGLSLTFESTTPTTIPAGSGTVTPTFPGAAALTALCQPPTCNPSPFNQIGLFGNGTPVASNAINVTAPGSNSTNLYIASTGSRNLVPVDFTTSQIGNPVQLPFVPNSMVISVDGTAIYMGSQFALMTFSTSNNSVTAQNTAINGAVLAVSPDGTTLIVTDPVRQLVYLYNTKTAVATTQYGGVGTHAMFTPDSSTVYVTLGTVDPTCAQGDVMVSVQCVTPNNQLLVHSTFTGWDATSSAAPQTPGGPALAGQATTDVAIAVPSVGAFFGGNPTSARSYCPVSAVSTPSGETTNSSTTTNIFFPDAGVTGPQTDIIATTNDGQHVLGATVTPTPTLTDLALGTSATPGLPLGACPLPGTPPTTFPASLAFTGTLPGVTATAITGVFPTSDSKYAFVTYAGTGGVVPVYTPQASGPGTLTTIPLATTPLGTPIAPVAGAVSADNNTFFVGTSGDNAVHLLVKGTNGYQDSVTSQGAASPAAPIAPNLTCAPGMTCSTGVGTGVATPNLIVQKPRVATS
jgi:trimeric autotransporter adhesin